MSSINVTLPDGSKRTYDMGTTPQAVARDISPRLEKDAVAATADGKLVDLTMTITQSCNIAIVTRNSPEGLDIIRHSTAHLLAHAVKELYPDTQITIGPTTKEGFYYDFDRDTPFKPEDLPKIEKRMAKIASRKLEVNRKEWPDKEEAAHFFEEAGESFKAEIIRDIPEKGVSTYQQGEFIDLCRGPHVPNTGKLGKYKLLSIAGAYWRGDEKNKMLQRIYGTAFNTAKELELHLHQLEEAQKRDHRRLGPEMGLFTFFPVSPTQPFYLPKGTELYQLLTDFVRHEMKVHGYQEVICPLMMSVDLWHKSGHMDHYKDGMFFIEGEEGATMALKPMNCPGHLTIFASQKRSYKEMPIRFSEFSRLHRNERAGATHGLLRTRAFSQDDGHIFCRTDQVEEESIHFVEHTLDLYHKFGFDQVDIHLATGGDSDQFMGEPEEWKKATEALESALKKLGKKYVVDEGEAAFYGPKIEFHVLDSIGRTWQCGTLQFDFNLPGRFELYYIDNQNQAVRPIMLHRAALGSFERFMGILIEHHAGHLPPWISPVQAQIITVSENQNEYARTVTDQLCEAGIRAVLDTRNEKLGYKIREAQLQRIPYMVILGNNEVESKTISLRRHTGKMENNLSLDDFLKMVEPDVKPPLTGGTCH